MMRSQPAFQRLEFEKKVNDALKSIERVLEIERRPQLAGDVEHTFGSKYALVDMTSNVAVISYANVLEKMGLNSTVLKSLDKTQATTLRFDASLKCKFEKEVVVDVPMNRSFEEETKTKSSGIFGNSESTRVSKAVQHITEFHYNVETSWSLSVYSGSLVKDKQVIKSRASSANIITQSKDRIPVDIYFPPHDLSLTWLLKQIDTNHFTSQFKVDIEDEETKTPRRNKAVDEAIDFSRQLSTWSDDVNSILVDRIAKKLSDIHNPALTKPLECSLDRLDTIHQEHFIFNPILPLMEEESDHQSNSDETLDNSTIALRCGRFSDEDAKKILSIRDMSKLLHQHAQNLEKAMIAISDSFPSEESNSIFSCVEFALVVLTQHIKTGLCENYIDSMDYVESMMEAQLIAAVGKRLNSDDLDAYIKFNNARILSPTPKPFSHAISRPNHTPVGLLSIERADSTKTESIYSHSRYVNVGSQFHIPLNAATLVELEGNQVLHGWLQHRFGHETANHNIVARARQFSAFVLILGRMTAPTTLEPQHATIVQNKDEVLIPLLVSELPTAKEFKDAIKSLSPKQQQFARAFRSMQLASSVFGVAIVQIKPQLESLLGLPPDSLDKEMKLTQDLMTLFVEFQVPSDLISYNGDMRSAAEDKVFRVKENAKAVMDVIDGEKEKQLKAAQLKTEMAVESAFQTALADGECESAYYMSSPCPAPAPGRGAISSRRLMKSSGAPMMAMAASPPMVMDMIDMNMASMTAESSKKSRFGSGYASQQSPVDSAATDSNFNLQHPSAKSGTVGQGNLGDANAVDFTMVPKILDDVIEKSEKNTSLRSTVLKTSNSWVRNRQENILAPFKSQRLNLSDIKDEKNKAFDLLDALSRSGSLPIKSSELHVVVAVTHCFEKDVMNTVVRNDIDPIEQIEISTLLFASTIHGVPARQLIKDESELNRLKGSLPLLLKQEQEDGVKASD